MHLFLLFFVVFIGLILLPFVWASVSLAPFVPTRTKDLKRIFKLANLKQGEIFYDLGCGNGKLAIYAARKFNVKAVGIEAAWPMWLICQWRKLFYRSKNIEFKFGNLFNENLGEADMVYFFGMPDSIKKRLKEKLKQELKPGARVISYAFKVPGWQPQLVDKPSKKSASIYLYKIGD